MSWPRPAEPQPQNWPRPARAGKAEYEYSFWPRPALSRDPSRYPNLAALMRLLHGEEAWRDDALCRKESIPTEKFFPWRGESQVTAKEVCSRCSVAQECREYAEDYDMRGIWGGELFAR